VFSPSSFPATDVDRRTLGTFIAASFGSATPIGLPGAPDNVPNRAPRSNVRPGSYPPASTMRLVEATRKYLADRSASTVFRPAGNDLLPRGLLCSDPLVPRRRCRRVLLSPTTKRSHALTGLLLPPTVGPGHEPIHRHTSLLCNMLWCLGPRRARCCPSCL
jgi:hypothetical protein